MSSLTMESLETVCQGLSTSPAITAYETIALLYVSLVM